MNRTVSLSVVAHTVMWTAGVGLILAGVPRLGWGVLPPLGLALIAAAATVQIRCSLAVAEHRERDMFEMGRDLERNVRSIR